MVKSTFSDLKYLILIIPVVGGLIGLAFIFDKPDNSPSAVLINIAGAIAYTATIWIGCRTIIPLLYRFLPWEKRPIKHLILEVAFILGYTLLITYISVSIYQNLYFESDETYNFIQQYFVTLVITFLITSIYEGVFFYNQWKLNLLRSEKLLRENLEAQYETLKSQVNPHFLFNSLNTLLTFVEENPRASEYVQKLSDFMRYVLKNREIEVALLRDEINMIKKYIFLQKSRFLEHLNVQIQVPEKYYHYSIAPLALQMLVENAIKHNVISKDRPLSIKISVEKDYLYVENNLQKKIDPKSTGLGLENIKRRYKFLTHKEVKIEENNQTFKVSLPLVILET